MWHHGGGWGWNSGYGGWPMMILGFLVWAFFIALAVLVVLWVVRSSRSGSRHGTGAEPDAMEIARRRYARGELTKEQFEQIKQDLAR